MVRFCVCHLPMPVNKKICSSILQRSLVEVLFCKAYTYRSESVAEPTIRSVAIGM